MNRWWMKLARYARPETRALFQLAMLMLAGILLGLLSPWPLKLIVDCVLADKPLPDYLEWIQSLPAAQSPRVLLAWLAAATVGIFLLTRCVSIVMRYVETGVGSRMVYALATDLFIHIQRRSLLLHFQSKTGDLIKRVTADTGCVRDLVIRVVVPGVQSVLTLIGMFVVMWQMSPGLAILALALSAPLIVIIRLLAEPLSQNRYREQELQGQIYSLAEQTLSAMPVVQSFGREQHHNDHFDRLARRTIGASLRCELAGHQFKVSTSAVTAIATACVMVYGGLAVRDGRLSVGTLLVLLAYFAALYSPLENLAYLSEGLASAKAGARRVLELLDEDCRPMSDEPGARPLVIERDAGGATIKFDGVAFGYAPNRPVLDSVSFEILPGETVAIVGETGVGKSTLMSLLLRFFDPIRGRIYIDGHDIRLLTLESLRNNIAYVPQKPFLLPLSIAENIAYGRPDASREEIVTAALSANADPFIRQLPQGYDTVISERGVSLSAGQKQRLSLARALLKDAPILILDEPTSALDPATEASIFNDVGDLFAGRTTFIVAHRFSTIQRATTAIVVENGGVVESGSPQELLTAGGRFYRLHQLQVGHQLVEPRENSCASH